MVLQRSIIKKTAGVILKQISEEIKDRSDNIIFLDFENTAVLNAIPDEMALLGYIDSHRKKSLCYVLFGQKTYSLNCVLFEQPNCMTLRTFIKRRKS